MTAAPLKEHHGRREGVLSERKWREEEERRERRRSRWRSERGKKKMERNGEGGTKCGGKALRTPKHTM